SLRQGITKMFYKDGKLHAEIHFKDGKKHGLEKSYYKSGEAMHIGLNHLGKQDSTWVWFYENGAIEEKSDWINGASHGETITYYKDGSLKAFHFYNTGYLRYKREYDSIGNVLKEEGNIPMGI